MVNVQKNKISKFKGFSLVELAVVLSIVGVLGVGTGLMYSEQKNQAEWQESQAKLDVVKSAILKFSEVNKYMPCPSDPASSTGLDDRKTKKGQIPAIPAIPATPAIPKTATSPTIPAIPSQGAQPAIGGINVSTCKVNVGNVPYASLGLSMADVHDAWGNPFTYAVDQGVTDANIMLNCPEATACFFNKDPKPVLPAGKVLPGSVLPAFSMATEPLKGILGANNLEICADDACAVTQAEGLVAVLLASNDDGFSAANVSNGEVQNQKGEKVYVNQSYSKEPFYDDVVLGISAYEIKKPAEKRMVENAVAPPPTGGPTVVNGQNVTNAGNTAYIGAVGDNNAYSDNVTVDRHSQTLNFGSGNANKKIVLTLDTKGQGTWDQGGTYTEDRAYIQVNGNTEETLAYDKNNSTIGTTTADGDLVGDTWNADDNRYDLTWSQSREYVVNTDANGDVLLDFAVATTGTDESVSFSNIVLTLYDTPPTMPDFPKVDPIRGIVQTRGLN